MVSGQWPSKENENERSMKTYRCDLRLVASDATKVYTDDQRRNGELRRGDEPHKGEQEHNWGERALEISSTEEGLPVEVQKMQWLVLNLGYHSKAKCFSV